MGIIYKVTNNTNGKIYIGQTQQTFTQRKYNHSHNLRSGLNRPLYNAIRRDGNENFTWEIIYECLDKKELDKKEKYFIRKYKSLVPYGYNLTTGGEGAKHHLTTIEGMRERFIGDKNPAKRPEVRAKMSRNHADFRGKNNPNYGKGDKIRGERNPNALIWMITDLSTNTTKTYRSLIPFCNETGFKYMSVYSAAKFNRPFRGYTIKSPL